MALENYRLSNYYSPGKVADRVTRTWGACAPGLLQLPQMAGFDRLILAQQIAVGSASSAANSGSYSWEATAKNGRVNKD